MLGKAKLCCRKHDSEVYSITIMSIAWDRDRGDLGPDDDIEASVIKCIEGCEFDEYRIEEYLESGEIYFQQ